MGVRNCSRCGKIFNYVAGQPICETCRKELETDFQKVKDYIKENPNQGIKEVAEGCEVSEGQIKQWVREERLEFSKGAGVLNCEQCGAPIATGRFCEKCKAAMTGNLNASIQPGMEARRKAAMDAAAAAVKNKGGMRFIKN
ncbi:MAG: flagellar protein [Lachnospiraceae bacterium]|nr:flagellar protein [Lachnospiraceae bacterium]